MLNSTPEPKPRHPTQTGGGDLEEVVLAYSGPSAIKAFQNDTENGNPGKIRNYSISVITNDRNHKSSEFHADIKFDFHITYVL